MVFASELSRSRREVLRAEYEPRETHSTAEAAALVAGRCEWLAWTSPCQLVTRGRYVRREERAEAVAKAGEQMAEAMDVLTEYVMRCMPAVILGEQAGGLVSHYGTVFQALTEGLLHLPYAWWVGVVNTAKVFRAPCNRLRVGWVAVRLDRLLVRVPRRCVGKWWWQEEGGAEAGRRCACGARKVEDDLWGEWRCVMEGCLHEEVESGVGLCGCEEQG